MPKSISEFREELRALRLEMGRNAHRADAKLLASWIDKLAISLEGFTETLDMFDNELEMATECCCAMCEVPPPKPAKKTKKPANKAPKKAKKAAKKKRR